MLAILIKTTIQKPKVSDLHIELLPVHSPLLRESFSFSFPPLTYMLKFSGSSRLISYETEGREVTLKENA